MPNNESQYFDKINEATAARREAAENEERKQAALEYVKRWEKELRREKACDLLYMAVVLAMLMYGLFCCYRIGIIPLSVTVPAEIVCVSLAVVCLGDSIRLFSQVRKMGGERK